MRRKSRQIYIGKVPIGGNALISVQSMTNTDTRDVNATVKQILALEHAGCEIVRLAVINEEAAVALKKIKALTKIPLIADIHFDYRLALLAMDNGVDGLRINPGNIGGSERVKKVVAKAKEINIPIRIGVNAGSLEKELLEKYKGVTAQALVESALKHISILEKENFINIKVSLKSSHVPLMLESYRLLANKVDYAMHIGVTEAGTYERGVIKSAVGIGILLSEGIGDTIRVSLTGDPIREIKAAYEILRALTLRERGPEIISCPTCGRTEVALEKLALQIEDHVEKLNITKPLKIAVMGCVVNGPGEAREADIGIAGGKGEGLIFKHGQVIKKVKESELLPEFLRQLAIMLQED